MSDNDEKILNAELNSDELETVTGGKCRLPPSGGSGSCTGEYYKEKCDATVEKHSWCSSHDYCVNLYETYKQTHVIVSE